MQRVLIVGAGDVARRAIPALSKKYRVLALTRNHQDKAELRALGAIPILADLDDAASLNRVAGIADHVLYLAPPPQTGAEDPRLRRFCAALNYRNPHRRTAPNGRSVPRRFVYISTTGVYGDCQGAWVDETRATHPVSARARRRVAAECDARSWARRQHVMLSILRVPGIYAANRLPTARLERADPVLLTDEDVYTNHIHADDLAEVLQFALWRGRPLRTYNISDQTQIKMGDFYDRLADYLQLPRPPRADFAECAARLSPMALSFMRESRRINNQRARRELKWRLRYPDLQFKK